MKRAAILLLASCVAAADAFGQGAVRLPEQEQRERERRQEQREQTRVARRTANLEIVGNTAIPERELRTRLREQIASIEEFGLTAARADDAAFFLELYYRQRGYADASVRYSLPGGDLLRLEVNEGPLVTISNIEFIGNYNQPPDKLFDYVVGPTRERVAAAKRAVPFVARDLEEGADLVHRVYVAEGYLESIVQEPHYRFSADRTQVEVSIAIVEGRQYSFGDVTFTGNVIFPPDELRQELNDVLVQPYTAGRVADIPRRLQAYFKKRGYYAVKVDATGNPAAARGGAVPVQVTISPGPKYEFDGVTVTGLQRLRPSFVTRRFTALSGRTYSPDLIDERFRKLMRTGLFNILQINPVPVGGDQLRLEITAEEARSKELGLSLGYGSWVGPIVGASYRDRNLFGYGRPITLSGEWTGRGYRGEIMYEDPFLFDTENELRVRLSALTFDFEGYDKFELGGRIELTREVTKQYKIGAFITARHVEVTDAQILPEFLGRASYQANSIGLSQTLDLRESPHVNPRGLVADHTVDVAADIFGSQVEWIRSTFRVSYHLSFAPPVPTPGTVGIDSRVEEENGFRSWFQRSSLAFGARVGIIKAIAEGAEDQVFDLPIDERFFNGGASSVRSFTERDLGPRDRVYPIGGEFYTIFNVEYMFPIWGEIMGAVFMDAGNLLPNAEDAGLDDMRYGIGAGLRYQLPIGPIRLDYAVNPNPKFDEPSGAFHFSFGFAF
jgi:outer membrane protein insertion porin family